MLRPHVVCSAFGNLLVCRSLDNKEMFSKKQVSIATRLR